MVHATLLKQYKHLLNPQGKPILDLACGNGQNGLYLHSQGLPVQFADNNNMLLEQIQSHNGIASSQCEHVDFETGQHRLSHHGYQAIIVFRYLHRPLFTQIKSAIEPGGFIIYETFTTENRQFGRPNRDDFLLKSNELKELFKHWKCVFYFEGFKHNPDRAIAQIICQKPMA